MNEIRALTGIRGIAALTVFLAHTRETLWARGIHLPVSQLTERLLLSGGRQVDIFFVLSGFILTLVYSSGFDHALSWTSYARFLRRRLARIYPLHVFMLVLTAGIVIAAYLSHAEVLNGITRFTAAGFLQNILLIHAWGIFAADASSWNPPSWSISIEALAYLLFPAFLWMTAGLRKNRPWLLLLAALAGGFACNAMTGWGLTGFSGISRGLTEFALGCATASLFRSKVAEFLRSQAGSAAAVCVLLVCFALTRDTGFIISVCATPLLLSLSGRNLPSAFLGWGPMYFLGEISYSIYLGHFLFSSMAYRLVNFDWLRNTGATTAVGLLVISGIVLGLSTFTYFAVERPGRDLLAGARKPKSTRLPA